MGTVFLRNLAVVEGKYERYDVLSAILDFETHNRLSLKKLQLLKTLKKTLKVQKCDCCWIQLKVDVDKVDYKIENYNIGKCTKAFG